MRPPTELERLAVFLAAVAVTRLLLPLPVPPERPGAPMPSPVRQAHRGQEFEDVYRARYGANNPGAN